MIESLSNKINAVKAIKVSAAWRSVVVVRYVPRRILSSSINIVGEVKDADPFPFNCINSDNFSEVIREKLKKCG